MIFSRKKFAPLGEPEPTNFRGCPTNWRVTGATFFPLFLCFSSFYFVFFLFGASTAWVPTRVSGRTFDIPRLAGAFASKYPFGGARHADYSRRVVFLSRDLFLSSACFVPAPCLYQYLTCKASLRDAPKPPLFDLNFPKTKSPLRKKEEENKHFTCCRSSS